MIVKYWVSFLIGGNNLDLLSGLEDEHQISL